MRCFMMLKVVLSSLYQFHVKGLSGGMRMETSISSVNPDRIKCGSETEKA